METDRVEGYATALFELARAEGVLPTVEEELFNLSHVLAGNDELRTTLSDPLVPAERRQAIIEDLIGSKASQMTTLLVSFVVAAGRGRELPAIISAVIERAAADRRHAVAEVRSAVPLDEDQRRRLAVALSKALGKEVEVKVHIDPTVLGGLSARVGDVVIDGTVRHRLEQLKETIR